MPRDKFVVVTGVSGSGKSTLAFDLLFAEGQRRFLDSMNVYARQFVEQLSRPDVDLITGIPPTVSIEQRTSRGGGKSTVATVTEIYHFIRLLFARLGTQYCPDCQVPVEAQTRDELGRRLRGEVAPARRPAAAGAGGEESQGLSHRRGRMGRQPRLRRSPRGWANSYGTSERLRLDRFREHNVEIVRSAKHRVRTSAVSAIMPEQSRRPNSSLESTLKLGSGTLLALDQARASLSAFDRARLPEVRPLVRAAGSEEFQLQLAPGLVPALPRLRRTVLPARRGPRRARGRHRGIVVRMAGGRTGALPGMRRGAAEPHGPGGAADRIACVSGLQGPDGADHRKLFGSCRSRLPTELFPDV